MKNKLKVCNPYTIQTNFQVPKTCRHEWVLFVGKVAVASIYGVPGKREIKYTVLANESDVDDNTESTKSLTLDWIAETVEHLRCICQQA